MNVFKEIDDGKILTPVFRLSFPDLFKRGKYLGKTDTGWGCVMLFQSNETSFSVISGIIDDLMIGKWGKRPGGFKHPVKDGSERDYEGYGPGTSYLSARSKMARIKILNVANEEIVEDDGSIKAGDYCRASISPWICNNEKRGIFFNLHQIKKIKDGEPFCATVDNSGNDFGDTPKGNDFNDDLPY